jgi:hypothetical protein
LTVDFIALSDAAAMIGAERVERWADRHAATHWRTAGRMCSNGRMEVACRRAGHYFWLNACELRAWVMCPSCMGWWNLS